MRGRVRERSPNRRFAETFDLVAGGLRYTTTIGFHRDGRIGEIFLTNHKAGSQGGFMASDSAMLCSIALQYGVTTEALRHALMRDSHGTPSLGVVLDQFAERGDAMTDNAAGEVPEVAREIVASAEAPSGPMRAPCPSMSNTLVFSGEPCSTIWLIPPRPVPNQCLRSSPRCHPVRAATPRKAPSSGISTLA